MATGFIHSDSYVLPYCPLVPLPDDDVTLLSEACQAEIDAAQALAAYRRIDESCDESDLAPQTAG